MSVSTAPLWVLHFNKGGDKLCFFQRQRIRIGKRHKLHQSKEQWRPGKTREAQDKCLQTLEKQLCT